MLSGDAANAAVPLALAGGQIYVALRRFYVSLCSNGKAGEWLYLPSVAL